MKIILEIAQKPDGTFAPAWRIEGKGPISVLLQAADWLKAQIGAIEVGGKEEETPQPPGNTQKPEQQE